MKQILDQNKDIVGVNRSHCYPTLAARKVPTAAEGILLLACLCLACTIRAEEIPSYCNVKSSQTKFVYSHGCQYTWTQRGGKQVPVVGKGEKRAYILLLVCQTVVSLSQINYQGQTLPSPSGTSSLEGTSKFSVA
jgi:hypothetical protein